MTTRHNKNPLQKNIRTHCAVLSVVVGLGLSDTSWAENYAMLVGVSEFPNVAGENLNLPGIDIDLDNMYRAVRQLGVAERNIIRLEDSDATAATVTQTLRRYAGDALTPDDRLFIYFSTHGGQITNDGFDVEADGLDEFLAFSDLQTIVVRDLSNDTTTKTLRGVLRDDAIGKLLADIQATTIVIIDACASATATKFLSFDRQDVLSSFGKFLSADWLRRKSKHNKLLADGQPRGQFDVPARDNLVVMAAAQDQQEAAATTRGSKYTNALVNALQSMPVTTPFCWHHHAYEEIVADKIRNAQNPVFTGQFAVANRSLFDADTQSSLQSFNQCINGDELQYTLHGETADKNQPWRVHLDHSLDGFVQAYAESAHGIDRLPLPDGQQRFSAKTKEAVWLPGVEDEFWTTNYPDNVVHFLLAAIQTRELADSISFTQPGWANLLNRFSPSISSAYTQLKFESP